MKIAENLESWYQNYQEGWLRKQQGTGEIDWDLYEHISNKFVDPSPGKDPGKSKLLFITSSGAYQPSKDTPFDAENPLGDYSVRTFPLNADFKSLDFAHNHYDQVPVRKDPQVLLPLVHLQEFVAEKTIGSLCPNVISFMGYQPDVHRVVTETIPEVLNIAQRDNAETALLVPS